MQKLNVESKFFAGFLVLIFPDKIFKKILKEDISLRTFISIFISMSVLVTFGVYLFKIIRGPAIMVTWINFLTVFSSLYFIVIIASSAISLFFDWVYTLAIKVKNRPIESNFAGNFLCHLYILPFWFFLIFLFINLKINWWSILLFAGLIIRFLDIETRLIKVVYRLGLIQGYLIMLLEVLFIWVGINLGGVLIKLTRFTFTR